MIDYDHETMISSDPPMLQTEPRHLGLAKVLHKEIAKVEQIFTRQLASDLTVVNDLCTHVERYRGKMLRPSLLLLTGLAVKGEPCDASMITTRHRTVATVLEMIHMATLIHDDVLDEADIRRRGVTLNSLRGNEMAVMLGDYLISNAFHLCSSEGDSAISELIGGVTNTICEGELLQLAHRDNMGLDEKTYLEILRRKTAVLVGACCRLGASISGAKDALVDSMERFGRALGVAFQIQDDLLDLAGDVESVGKSIGRDLATGKLTLPVILHLADEAPSDREETIRIIESRDAVALKARLTEHGAVERARAQAVSLVADAKRELVHLPQSTARELLGTLADAVVNRDA